MRVQIEKIHWIILGAGVCLLVVSVIFYYITAMRPLQAEKDRLQQDIEAWEAHIAAQDSREDESSAERVLDRYTLEQKLPTEPNPDQFLLELDKAEEMSGSYILSTHYQGETLHTNASDEANEEADTVNQDGARSFSYQVTVRSPDYANAERFTEVIDNSPRLIQINSLMFSGREELIYSDQAREPLEVNMVISTYYYDKEKTEEDVSE